MCVASFCPEQGELGAHGLPGSVVTITGYASSQFPRLFPRLPSKTSRRIDPERRIQLLPADLHFTGVPLHDVIRRLAGQSEKKSVSRITAHAVTCRSHAYHDAQVRNQEPRVGAHQRNLRSGEEEVNARNKMASESKFKR